MDVCECADPACPVHEGESPCTKPASQTLYRVDMEDETGVLFCEGCAADAFESDVFTTRDEGNDSEPEPDDDSITTEDHRRFFQYGKLVFTLTEDEDCHAGIKRELDRMNFWPNVFFISDHGNSVLIRYWEKE